MALHFLLDAPVTAQPGDDVHLTGSEAHHAAAVRRVRVGETVTVGDGRGVVVTGECISVSPREVVVQIQRRREEKAAAPRLVLAQALAKGDRDELAVQAATELGVDEILPWQAARSVSRWDAAKAAKGVARWSAIVREAAKQAHRAWVPSVADPVKTKDLAARAAASVVLVLDPDAETALTDIDVADAREIVVVVGPEGGITDAEVAELTEAGAAAVRLGSTVLRTSTAGPAALSVVNVRLGRW
ncbi:16S rRNA (uracil(1498)-N(3))-methyltransferase [Microbacterium koreense]|uniref:Ribosomal RNA small subunit methyltransferase E n=1 Tax=Microbacterium koreense TaxID=323761 RepID=A0ABW2ZS30_9MICO